MLCHLRLHSLGAAGAPLPGQGVEEEKITADQEQMIHQVYQYREAQDAILQEMDGVLDELHEMAIQIGEVRRDGPAASFAKVLCLNCLCLPACQPFPCTLLYTLLSVGA